MVLSEDPSAGSITVPGSSNAPINITFEDVRHAIQEDLLAISLTESIDKITGQIEDDLDKRVVEDDDRFINQMPNFYPRFNYNESDAEVPYQTYQKAA